MVAPLAIIQARLHSQRLPHKMLLSLGGKPLLQWAWETAVAAFGREHVVIACPYPDAVRLAQAVPQGHVFAWEGLQEHDVLSRLYRCACEFRSDPVTVIHRCTPDDVPMLLDRDWCSLRQLAVWHESVTDPYLREHVGYLFHPEMAVEVNTPEDLAYLERRLAAETIWDRYPSWPHESHVQ